MNSALEELKTAENQLGTLHRSGQFLLFDMFAYSASMKAMLQSNREQLEWQYGKAVTNLGKQRSGK